MIGSKEVERLGVEVNSKAINYEKSITEQSLKRNLSHPESIEASLITKPEVQSQDLLKGNDCGDRIVRRLVWLGVGVRGSTKPASILGTVPVGLVIGNISTLRSLVVEYNQMSGKLPPELGNLPNIQRLFLSSNFFTGEIPSTFAKLTNLTDVRLSDNQFTGTIPAFINNWTELEKLVIQASGLVGPIPRAIAPLAKLTDFTSP